MWNGIEWATFLPTACRDLTLPGRLGCEIVASDDRDDGGRSLSMARGDERLILEIYPSGDEGSVSVQYVQH